MAPRLPLLAAAAAACLLAACLPSVAGHGFMFQPTARNVIHNSDYCPHCLAAGGPWEVSAGNTLTWPAGVHGVCGDKAGDRKHETGGVYGPTAPQASYAPGSVITISLLITARHGGRHVFRLCPSSSPDEACFSNYVLQRADGDGPYTWQQPTGGPADYGSYSAGSYGAYSGEVYSMQYKLPDGVACDACTLQWWWTTGNSCDVPGSPFGRTSMELCTSPGPYPEEFWNCADISISGAGVTPVAKPVTPAQPQQPADPVTPAQPQPADPTVPAQPANPTPADPTLPSQPADPATPVDPAAGVVDRKINPGGGAAAGAGGDAAAVCAATGGAGGAYPGACSKFVVCGSVPAVMDCAPGTKYDTSIAGCNFEAQVDCGGRP